jgi:predicted GH43/DUF377 family glycosyl hydrolase
MKNLLTILLLIIVLAMVTGQATGQVVWTKDARNPVLSGGAAGTWNRHIFMPCVLYNSDSSRYEMWFGATYGTTSDYRPYRFGFASSKDGVHWTAYPSAVLEPTPGSWDAYSIEEPMVIRENRQYKMWYSGIPTSSWDKTSIGYATSTDGIHWTKYAGNPVMSPGTAAWEAGMVYSCSVMPSPGGYKMWYAGYSWNNTADIGCAFSIDGINWQRDTVNNPILTRGAMGQWDCPFIIVPQVCRIGSTYFLWYLGMNSDGSVRHGGLAASTDGGITWDKFAQNPVLSISVAGWDDYLVEPGHVLQRGDTLDMWYGATTGTYPYLWCIGHATSPLCSYAHVASIDRTYLRPGVDTVCVDACLMNLLNHTCGLSAIVTDWTGAPVDSLQMYDDGTHGDKSAGDNVWCRSFRAPSNEGIFSVSVRTDDITRGSFHRLPNAVRFTTAGPVAYVGDTVIVGTPHWGNTVFYKLKVANQGSVFTIPAVKATIRPLDTVATIALGNSISFGNIAPGQVWLSVIIRIAFSAWVSGPRDIPFELVFSSQGTDYWRDTMLVHVESAGAVAQERGIPTTYQLEQNYPNPFNPGTLIRYTIAGSRENGVGSMEVRLVVYDILGREVAVLVNEKKAPGRYEVEFDASGLSSGVYFYRLTSGQYVECRKMVVIK